jgi:hypothetical protein
MNKNKFFFSIISLSFIALFIGIKYWGFNISDTSPLKNISLENNNTELLHLKKDVSLIMSRIDEVEKKQALTELKITKAIGHIEEKLDHKMVGIDAENLEMTDGKHAEFEDAHTDEKQIAESVVSNYDAQLNSGLADDHWATSLENKINNSLESNLDNDTNLSEIRCETSLCKIEVDHKNGDSKSEFMINITKIDAFNDKETFYKTTLNSDGSESTILYVARDGFRLPELPEH